MFRWRSRAGMPGGMIPGKIIERGEAGATPPEGYDRVASALHWLIAALVLSMLLLGFYMVGVPRQTPLRGLLFDLHKSLGLVVLALMIVRVAWRLTHRPPEPLAGIGAINTRLAAAVHVLLYLSLLAQPIAGYVASSLGRYGVAFFGLPLPDWADENPELRAVFLDAHHLIARLLVLLILLHLAGTLLHLMQGQGAILRRILPWRTR
jgi:cytochrome b561